ncbi:unnamed protein product [Rotaria magnacalcarata]|uniref:VWFA domain-containing protein n=2 Tax=Rotaria magnacalcarata TaxID=392030 RepID=A0A815VMR3_9BILA|nr:unnamed protein product [Rotaria magnacalcarata]
MKTYLKHSSEKSLTKVFYSTSNTPNNFPSRIDFRQRIVQPSIKEQQRLLSSSSLPRLQHVHSGKYGIRPIWPSDQSVCEQEQQTRKSSKNRWSSFASISSRSDRNQCARSKSDLQKKFILPSTSTLSYFTQEDGSKLALASVSLLLLLILIIIYIFYRRRCTKINGNKLNEHRRRQSVEDNLLNQESLEYCLPSVRKLPTFTEESSSKLHSSDSSNKTTSISNSINVTSLPTVTDDIESRNSPSTSLRQPKPSADHIDTIEKSLQKVSTEEQSTSSKTTLNEQSTPSKEQSTTLNQTSNEKQSTTSNLPSKVEQPTTSKSTSQEQSTTKNLPPKVEQPTTSKSPSKEPSATSNLPPEVEQPTTSKSPSKEQSGTSNLPPEVEQPTTSKSPSKEQSATPNLPPKVEQPTTLIVPSKVEQPTTSKSPSKEQSTTSNLPPKVEQPTTPKPPFKVAQPTTSNQTPKEKQSTAPTVSPKVEQLGTPKPPSKEQSTTPSIPSKVEQAAALKSTSKEQAAAPKSTSKEQAAAPKSASKEQAAAPKSTSKEQAAAPKSTSKEQSITPNPPSKLEQSKALNLPPSAEQPVTSNSRRRSRFELDPKTSTAESSLVENVLCPPVIVRKVSATHDHVIKDDFASLDEIHNAIKEVGLDHSQLIFGIDYTISNLETGKTSFNGLSLHHIQDGLLNPYQSVITIVGRTLEKYDSDKLIPVFGFGDRSTLDRKIFPLRPDGSYCKGFRGVLEAYNEITPKVRMSGPTNFAPLIREAVRIVKKTGEYHILVIVADGQVTNERQTKDAIVEASNYPLSIVMIGVGDGPWDMMEEFDDSLPTRQFDNFQFVDYHSVFEASINTDSTFALRALMEIPSQYAQIKKLGLLNKKY